MSPPSPHYFQLLFQHGWESMSFQSLSPGISHWLSPDLPAAVAWRPSGRASVLAGTPLCAPEQLLTVLQSFQAGPARTRRLLLFGVERRALVLLQRLAERRLFTWVKIGEQPVLDPTTWKLEGHAFRSLRFQLRRASRVGVLVREVGAEALAEGMPLRVGVEELVRVWGAARAMSLMGFLVGVHPLEQAAHKRYFVAEQAGQLVGLLALVPVYAREGWLAEDLLRHPQAPNGAAELLIDTAMRTLGAEGVRYATLGLAPLSGDFEAGPQVPWWVSRLFRLSYAHGTPLYSFQGIRKFREKFRPVSWEPVYLVVLPGSLRLPALLEVLQAFVPGSRLKFVLETLWRLSKRAGRALLKWLLMQLQRKVKRSRGTTE